MRQVTDKAREFGAGPLFNQILPLLMSPTLEDQVSRTLMYYVTGIFAGLIQPRHTHGSIVQLISKSLGQFKLQWASNEPQLLLQNKNIKGIRIQILSHFVMHVLMCGLFLLLSVKSKLFFLFCTSNFRFIFVV